jgi:hypothetical protein
MEQAVIFAGVAVVVALAAAGVAAWWVMRSMQRMRRRLGVVTAAGMARAGRLTGPAVSGRPPMLTRELRLHAAAGRPRANPSWWSIRSERRSLRRSTSAAEHSVAAAVAAGAPVGELPALCRDLRRARRDADRQLMLAAMDARGRDERSRVQTAAVLASAARIRSLAVRTLAETTDPAADRLAAQVHIEASALDAGWSRLRDARAETVYPGPLEPKS